jgi:predicted NodU family carbamoyl transferase
LGAKYTKFSENDILKIAAEELSKEKTIGWFQGRM